MTTQLGPVTQLITSVASTAPAWFTNATNLAWTTPVSNTLNSVIAASGATGIVDAWTGAAVDQANGHYIIANNGGHTDSNDGNSVCRVALKNASPAWVRISTGSTAGSSNSGSNGTGARTDNTPVAVHGYNGGYKYCDGRLWWVGLRAMDGAGLSSTAVWSFDKAACEATASFPQSPTAGFWRNHGRAYTGGTSVNSGNTSWESGPAAADPLGHRVWSSPEYNIDSTIASIIGVDTTSGTAEASRIVFNGFTSLSGNPFHYAWSTVPQAKSDGSAFTNRCWLAWSFQNGNLWRMNVNSPGSFTQVTPSGSGPTEGSGAVYHQKSQAILVWNGGNTLYRLSVPNDPLSNTGWAWSTVALTGTVVTPANGPFSKFNIIDDMGNGQSCLCVVSSITGPLYCLKLPVAGV